MFEPVHGLAPDIAGKGIANPIGKLWSIVMMLEFLRARDASRALMNAIEMAVAKRKVLTPDLRGQAGTRQFTNAVLNKLAKPKT